MDFIENEAALLRRTTLLMQYILMLSPALLRVGQTQINPNYIAIFVICNGHRSIQLLNCVIGLRPGARRRRLRHVPKHHDHR